ncbi:hypothetical protein AB0H71_30000 [Nocardia sp. NPDC050697]|uniref:hypothetical protein n=1 Tax=Nocardia sp. NPDC050697 TaxID=3155158 RepID=UPI0033FD90E9
MDTDVTEDKKPEMTARQRGELEAIRRGWLKIPSGDNTRDAKAKAIKWMRQQGWKA